mmetsp:Transcript_31635/g.65752  ORF Transcript_31635/g.65752 Transcript_31635/m.65752 type:complete len:80 (+) Transcript_31635:435-674(+)
MISAALQIDIGITGAPALCAILKAPFLKGIKRFDRDRVPSGKVQRFTPFFFARKHISKWIVMIENRSIFMSFKNLLQAT